VTVSDDATAVVVGVDAGVVALLADEVPVPVEATADGAAPVAAPPVALVADPLAAPVDRPASLIVMGSP
jgi:hypothetical protein